MVICRILGACHQSQGPSPWLLSIDVHLCTHPCMNHIVFVDAVEQNVFRGKVASSMHVDACAEGVGIVLELMKFQQLS